MARRTGHGRGLPASAAYRLMRARAAQMPWPSRLGVVALASAAGAVLALVSGMPPAAGAALLGGLALALGAVLLAADTLKILVVLFGFVLIAPLLGGLYTSAPVYWRTGDSRLAGDLFTGTTLLLVAALCCVPVAVRFSRGRVWLTLLLAYASPATLGLALVLVAPWLGLFAAYAAMAAALMARCGGWAWLAGMARVAAARIRGSGEPSGGASLPTSAYAPELTATAALLADLPSGWQVFHGLQDQGHFMRVGHLAVGPSGGFVLASVSSHGPLSEDARHGLRLPDIALDEVVDSLMWQRRVLARRLKCMERDLALVVVVHGIGSSRRSVAAFAPHDPGVPLGRVTIVGEEALAAELSCGRRAWGPAKVAQVAYRARARLGASAALPAVPAT